MSSMAYPAFADDMMPPDEMDMFTLEHILERWEGFIISSECGELTDEEMERELWKFEKSYGGGSEIAVAIQDNKEMFIDAARKAVR